MKRHILLAVIITVSVSGSVLAQESNSGDSKKTGTTAAKKNAEANPGAAIKLESVFIGDKEQPAISYFIPWQGIGAPDKLYWNVEEKHDKALDLVDRDILLRSIQLYDEMKLETSQ